MPSPLDLALPAPSGWFANRALSAAAGAALRTRSNYTGHDAVLAQLADADPSLTNGLYNHAPMVVEALFAMGQGDKAQAWLDAQTDDQRPRRDTQTRTDLSQWRSALGNPARYSDWRRLFTDQLEHAPWRDVLTVWTHRLSDGFSSAACHGVIQTAHAARALRQSDTPIRRQALANALAAWASRFTPLDLPHRVLPLTAALGHVRALPAAHAPGEGMITAGFARLSHAPGFTDAMALADVSGGSAEQFDSLMIDFAHLFLDLARTRFSAIVFCHALTGCAAAAILADLAPQSVREALLYRAFEAGAALKAAFTPVALQAPDPLLTLPSGAPADRAVSQGDDHVIKLTEACLSAYTRTREPVFLHVIGRMFTLMDAR